MIFLWMAHLLPQSLQLLSRRGRIGSFQRYPCSPLPSPLRQPPSSEPLMGRNASLFLPLPSPGWLVRTFSPWRERCLPPSPPGHSPIFTPLPSSVHQLSETNRQILFTASKKNKSEADLRQIRKKFTRPLPPQSISLPSSAFAVHPSCLSSTANPFSKICVGFLNHPLMILVCLKRQAAHFHPRLKHQEI